MKHPTASSDLAAVNQVRHFNRFYTRRLRLLERGLLGTRLSLSEVRILYEIAHRAAPTAREIQDALDLDAGYLSRTLGALQNRRLVRAVTAKGDRRRRLLTLTNRGRQLFGELNQLAIGQVRQLLGKLDQREVELLVTAMGDVERILDDSSGTAEHRTPQVELRGPQPGDLGWVVQRHGELYAKEYGWDQAFERLVARIVGEFAAAPADDAGQKCWIATVAGRRAGCVFLTRHAPQMGQLRMLLVEPWARGHGLGERLVHACLDGARAAGYPRIILWTNSVLDAARHLYERAGFRLVKSEKHRDFGTVLEGQTWERTF